MAYPSRGRWRFRNVTKGVYYHPTLDSIQITQANPEDNATMSCKLVQIAQDFIELEDEVYVEFAGTKIFAGHCKTFGMAYLSAVGVRTVDLEFQDYTAKLDDSIIKHPKTRKSEPLADRIDWILGFLDYSMTTGGVNLPSATAENGDYDGMTVREALDQIADEQRLSYYVDYDKDIHIFRVETTSAPFDLNDVDPDYATDYTYQEWSHTLDSVELTNSIYVTGDKRRETVIDSGSIATWSRQERSLQDSELVNHTQIQNAALRALAENSQPQIDGSLVCWEPGLQAGMTFTLTNAEWGDIVDGNYIIKTVEIEAVDPHDENLKAYLKSTITYSDRRRARPYKNKRPPTFSEVVDGDALVYDIKCMSRLLASDDGHGGTADFFEYSDVPPGHDTVMDACAYATTYIYADCPFGESGFNGRAIEEQWIELDPGDLVGVVGVRVNYATDLLQGILLYVDYPLQYGFATAPPTDHHQYTLLGECSLDGGSFVVPSSCLTPNTTNYLVLAAGWEAIGAPMVCSGGLVAGLEGPLGGLSPGGGEFNSGRLRINFGDVVLRVNEGSGQTPWLPVDGDIDGVNRTYTLTDWNGKGVPEVRIGALAYAAGTDYEYDDAAGTITMGFAPWTGANVTARWIQ